MSSSSSSAAAAAATAAAPEQSAITRERIDAVVAAYQTRANARTLVNTLLGEHAATPDVLPYFSLWLERVEEQGDYANTLYGEWELRLGPETKLVVQSDNASLVWLQGRSYGVKTRRDRFGRLTIESVFVEPDTPSAAGAPVRYSDDDFDVFVERWRATNKRTDS